MKSFKYYADLLEAEVPALTNQTPSPESQQPTSDDGTQQRDFMKPNKEVDELVRSLREVIQVCQRALENRKNNSEEEANKESPKTDDAVADNKDMSGANDVDAMFGKSQA